MPKANDNTFSHVKEYIKALRSQKYKQGFGCLRIKTKANGDCFCALGVAADVFDCEWEPRQVTKTFYADEDQTIEVNEGDTVYAVDHSRYMMPTTIEENFRWNAFVNELNLLKIKLIEISIRNDGIPSMSQDPKTFEDIADWLEAKVQHA